MRPATLAVVTASLLALGACGPKSLHARMAEGEKLAERATEHLDEAERALDAREVERAEAALEDAREVIARPSLDTNPESELLKDRLRSLEARVAPVRAERARLEIEQKVNRRREVIAHSRSAFRKALLELEQRPTDREAMKQVRSLGDQLERDLGWERELQDKDPDFKAYVQALQLDVDASRQQLALSERGIEFQQGPARHHDEAAALLAQARAEKDPAVRLGHYESATRHLQDCQAKGSALLGQHPALATLSITTASAPRPAAQVVKQCELEAKAADKQLARTRKLVAAAEKKAALAKKREEAAAKRKAQLAAKKQKSRRATRPAP